jgi:hypothetical protein
MTLLLIPVFARAECAGITMPQILSGPFSASLVFKGSVKTLDVPPNQPFETVTFSVDKVWKGNVAREITLAQMHTAESIHFQQGTDYLIVAYDPALNTIRPPFPPNMLEISFCASRTIVEAERRGFLRNLGRGRSPRR